MTITEVNYPLYRLFTELRLAGLPLGIQDYEVVLRAVNGGLDHSDRDNLANVIRALWLKTRDPAQRRLFDHHFDRLIPLSYGREQAGTRPTRSETAAAVTEREEEKTRFEETAVSPPDDDDIELDDFASETDEIADPAYQSLTQLEGMSAYQDEAQIAQSAQGQMDIVSHFYYSFTSDYLPVTSRQMKQNWRYMRRAARFGPPVELDIEATVNKIARDGFLADPVLRPRRTNRAELILLLDRDGSMVPFHSLGRRLETSAKDGGRLGSANIFYFHDCPGDFLYLDPYYREFVPLQKRIEQAHPMLTSLLIFSDAGAARGRIDRRRIEQTLSFLSRLDQTVRHIAWLNPMPRDRWRQSSAGYIAQRVAMFETNRLGLQGAIKALRGFRPHAQER